MGLQNINIVLEERKAAEVTPTKAVAHKDALEEPSMPAKESATKDAESLKQPKESEEDTSGIVKKAEATVAPGYIRKTCKM